MRISSANEPRHTLPKPPASAIAVAILPVPRLPGRPEVNDRSGRVVRDDPDRRLLWRGCTGRRIGDRELDVLAGERGLNGVAGVESTVKPGIP